MELVDGDWNDPAAIKRALEGVEGAFVMLPAVWAPSPDFAEAFATARKGEAQAVNVFASPFLSSLSGEIIGIAAAHRVPTIYQWKENVENGGLVSYGPSLVQLWRQAGNIAAKLLKGAKPADMPVEQPTKFELVINTRTAKAIGINLPPSLLVRADEVLD